MWGWLGSARLLGIATLAIALFSGVPASAQERDRADRLASPIPSGPSEWALDVQLATAVPTVLGGEVRLETPGRFLLSLLVGGNPYSGVIGDLVQSYGASPSVHTFVGAITGSAGTMRLQAGWRPTEDAGLEILGGYTLMYSTPTVTRATLEGVTGQSFAYTGFDAAHLEVVIHAVSAELGWRFVVADHLVLRLGVGGTFTFAASARLDVPDAMREAAPAVADVESQIASGIRGYGFMPEARVAVGYRF